MKNHPLYIGISKNLPLSLSYGEGKRVRRNRKKVFRGDNMIVLRFMYSVFFVCILNVSSHAGVESVSAFIKGSQVAANAFIPLEDFQYATMNGGVPSTWGFKNKLAEGWIESGVDRANTVYNGSDYNIDLELHVEYWIHNGSAFIQTTVSPNPKLHIKYDHLAATNEIDRARNLYPGAHKISVTVVAAYDYGTANAVSIPQNLYVESVINVERYHNFNETAVPFSSCSSCLSHTAYDINTDNFKDELEIRWNYIPGAEEYDLEWTFVNDYDNTGYQTANPATAIPFSLFDFEHNCTRVRITDPYYRIPLLMDRGYVIYRLRGIGRGGINAGVDFDKIVYGKWSADALSSASYVSDFSSSSYYNTNPYCSSCIGPPPPPGFPGASDYIPGGHEKKKNWQVTSTFAEDGKRKEVISYFDGTLRNRQTVTRINSADSIALIGETIYDHQGRAAIQTLPAPTAISSRGSTVIKYYPFFSLSATQSPYNRADFDLDPGNICALTVNPMDSLDVMNPGYLGGAALYYSSNNALVFSHRDYIPTAKGFPFTLVEYEPDNTNRIRTQTGVGKDHNLLSGHATQYFYGQPEQEQLDRLFATEAGYSQHYKKNMVIDANGQVSVTYLDMQGRTVATSLAGDGTENLLPLTKTTDDNTTLINASAQAMTVDLLAKVNPGDKDTPLDNNKVSADSTALTYSAQKLVAAKSIYDFNYSLTAPTFTATCSPFCYPPAYDLEIHVKDQCGNEWLATPVSATELTATGCSDLTYSAGPALGLTSDDPNSTDPEMLPGSYTVEKVLTVNPQAVDLFTKQYEQYLLDAPATNTCVLTYNDFLEYNQSQMHLEDCELTCEDCIDELIEQLGSRSSYLLNGPGTLQENADRWDAIYNECVEPCKKQSVCQVGYNMMLRDVSPGGQYGQTSGPDFLLSVFNTLNVLPPNASPGNYPDYTHPSPEYRDEFGKPSLIEVSYSGLPASLSSSYEPPVVDPLVNVIPVNGKYYTAPEHMEKLSDFLDLWEENWAASLVKYHPEYQYYKWCDPLSTVTSGGNAPCYSNDDYDYALYTINTYNAATAATLTVVTTSTPFLVCTLNLTVVSDVDALLEKDPFFNSYYNNYGTHYGGTTQCNSANTFRTVMRNLLLNYNNGMTMWDFAAFTARCGTWYGNNAAFNCPGYGSAFGSYAPTQDQEWNLFKSFYLAEKQKFMQQAADQYMVDNWSTTLDYNYCGCVGEDPFSPFYACPAVPKNYIGGFPWTILSFPFGDGNQPCSFYKYQLYKQKARRFGFSDLLPPPSPSTFQSNVNWAEYNFYKETGLCPIAEHLKGWLNSMAKTSGGLTSDQSLFDKQGFTPKLYETISGIDPDNNVYTEFTWDVSFTSAVLSVNLTPGSSILTACSTGTSLSLTIPSSASLLDWSAYGTGASGWGIISFTDISPITNTAFKIKAQVDEDLSSPTNTPIEVIFDGSTCFNLKDCGSTDFANLANSDCVPSDEARDLQDLMSILSGFNKLNLTSSGQDLTVTPYSVIFNKKLASYLPSGNWRWEQQGLNTQFRITTGGSDYLQIDLASGANSGDDFTNINSLLGVPNKNFSMDINGVSVQGHITDISVSGTQDVYSGSCDYPNTCKTQEHFFRTGLEKLLNGFVTPAADGGAPPASGGTTISGTKWFSTAMHNFLSGGGAESFGAYNAITSSTFSVTIKDKNNENSPVFCTVELFPVNPTQTAPNYSTITSLSDLVADENKLVNGKVYEFTVKATVSTSTVAITLRGKSCFPIKNCKDCIPMPAELMDCKTAHASYTLALTNLNGQDLSGNPAFAMPDSVFCKLSLENCWEAYINYLDAVNCTSATQNTDVTLQQFCQGSYSNCSVSYANYYNEVQNYLSGNCLYLFVSLSDYCRSGIGAQCQGAYNTYFSGCGGEAGNPLTILQFCEGHPVEAPCDPYPPSVPTFTIAVSDPCSTYQYAIAQANATAQYNQYIKSLKDQFKHDYIQHCMTKAVEQFEMTYTDKEYHYTLYYYDQAGNLVRTVPPAGVNTLTLTDTYQSSTVGQQIKDDRFNNTIPRNIFTNHTFATTYRYNSLNQLVDQSVPDNKVFDGGSPNEILQNFSTRFYYDRLGRLVVSQNSKQYNKTTDHWTYSYTLYDALGRTKEVGEISFVNNCPPCQDPPCPGCDPIGPIEQLFIGNQLNDAAFSAWIAAGTKTEVTKTFYDDPIALLPVPQDNLRNRVSSMTYMDTWDADPGNFDYGLHYSYDLHSNVKQLTSDNRELSLLVPSLAAQRYKNITYNYDLISGNVNDVFYQRGEVDQFTHHYEYDADNRIANVFTSKDYISLFPTFQLTASLWDQDAKYFYYPHGPLMRVETGHLKVQGMDYAYTIQGWMKGVNSNTLKAYRDIGKDGHTSGLNKYIGQDEYGYSLNYFRGDYLAIGQNGGGNLSINDNMFLLKINVNSDLNNPEQQSVPFAKPYDLFNGNIRSMVTSIGYFMQGGASPQAYAYRYDQLNRIKSMSMFNNADIGVNNVWQSTAQQNIDYEERFKYDQNGNILKLYRYGQGKQMDDMKYYYYTSDAIPTVYDPEVSTPVNPTNKLAYIGDVVQAGKYQDDIDDQSALSNPANSSKNYDYDAIGNLKQDLQEEIENIDWTVYGKVKSVTRVTPSTKEDLEFKYDPSGNRICKIAKPRTGAGGTPGPQSGWLYTCYTRDAQGNILSTYRLTGVTATPAMQLKEQYIYGSNRAGIMNFNADVTTTASTTAFTIERGEKNYELTNHLGNVLAVVSDQKIPHDNSGVVDFYNSKTVAATDYYSFGMQQPGRSFNSPNYRYGFNGKEKDDEVHGSSGTSYDYGARIYDPRVGRWLSIDPLITKFPGYSPYNFGLDNPVLFIDKGGEDPREAGKIVTINSDNFFASKTDKSAEESFIKHLNDKDLYDKADRWYFISVLPDLLFQIFLGPGKGIPKPSTVIPETLIEDALNSMFESKSDRAESLVAASQSNKYTLVEQIKNDQGVVDGIVERRVANLGKGFEAEVVAKAEYDIKYSLNGNNEVKATATLKKETFISVVPNKNFKKTGSPTATVQYFYKIVTFDYTKGADKSPDVSITTQVATPRTGNVANPNEKAQKDPK